MEFQELNKPEKITCDKRISKDKTFLKRKLNSESAKIKWYPKSGKLT
jgi:hypothetical protein